MIRSFAGRRSHGTRLPIAGVLAWALVCTWGAVLVGGVPEARAAGHEKHADHGKHAGHDKSADHAKSALPRSARPEAARLYFISPEPGATVRSPVVVRFGLAGMGVAPSGVEKDATGHHHLIVDGELPPMGLPIPQSDTYRHFGGGQTETTVELAPGRHTLQLLLGDHLHIPHDPPVVSERIEITVAE